MIVKHEIPTSSREGMRVPALLVVSQDMKNYLDHEYANNTDASFAPALSQVIQVASLPGVVGSVGLPDIHTGYGFAIGHVGAFDMDNPNAIVSPGGVGFDINCGVILLQTNLHLDHINKPEIKEALADALYAAVPVGLETMASKLKQQVNDGKMEMPTNKQDPIFQVLSNRGTMIRSHSGESLHVSADDIRDILKEGLGWSVRKGIALKEDQERCEGNGVLYFTGCDQNEQYEGISQGGLAIAANQLGTLGSGNHYVELQYIESINDTIAAEAMGINQVGQLVIMVHCGSRKLGHTVASHFVEATENDEANTNILPPGCDKQLSSALINSPLGQNYLRSMMACSNYAYVNRNCIAQSIRYALRTVFPNAIASVVYDVAHNIAREEMHFVPGCSEPRRLLVHRKGSTRAFPPKHPELPLCYSEIGQPVLVGGSMGTSSWVLTGTEEAMKVSFGSTCHGAGRAMGRKEANRKLNSQNVLEELNHLGIVVRTPAPHRLAEEAPSSYKDVDEVVEICEKAGISLKTCKLKPIIVIKG